MILLHLVNRVKKIYWTAIEMNFIDQQRCYASLTLLTLLRQLHKMVIHTQTIRRQQPTNCLNVFVYSAGFKKLTRNVKICKVSNSHKALHGVEAGLAFCNFSNISYDLY